MKTKILTSATLFVTAFHVYGSSLIFQDNDKSSEVRYINEIKWQPDASYQKTLRNSVAWQNFLQKNGPWQVIFNEQNAKPHRAFGSPIQVSGSDASDKALNFINNELTDFNIPLNELQLVNAFASDHFQYINFTQYHQGLQILNSRLTIKMTLDNKVILWGADVFDNIAININPSITASAAKASAEQDLQATVKSSLVKPDLFILPVPQGKSNIFKLIYEVNVEAVDNDGLPAKFYTLVDAHNGEVLYRENQVKTEKPRQLAGQSTEHKEQSLKQNAMPRQLAGPCAMRYAQTANTDVYLTSNLYATNPKNPATVEPLTYLKIVAGATNYYTDTAGYVGMPFTSPTSAALSLEGSWCKVQTSNVVPSFTTTLNPGVNNLSFDTDANITERTAYYHVNIIHDQMKSYFPAFTGLDWQMETNVDLTSSSCNAFYSGTSINFYAAGGGCNSIGQVGDVVYHEYGHGINSYYYSSFGQSFNNGAMGEGNADIWGMSITLSPILGSGFYTANTDGIRRYDINPKVYPQDIVGEVHADGEIIAGAWWDTYLNLGDMNQMMALFSETYNGFAATAANGQEGQAFYDVLIDALQADDVPANGGDNDITNGTPNCTAIGGAFALHGISLLSNVILTHNEVLSSTAGNPVTIDAVITFGNPWAFNAAKVFYKIDNDTAWNSLSMTNTGGNNYTVDIPAQPCGTIIAYYLAIEGICGNVATIIPGKAANPDPNIPFFILVGYNVVATEDFDFATMGVWTTGVAGDNATTGLWIIDIPVGSTSSSGSLVQTDAQHTPGGQNCAVTGNAPSPTSGIGTNDIDGGHTTLETPVLDLSSYNDPVVTYYRWYINDPPGGANPANDWWEVRISNDGVNWFNVEGTKVSDGSWRRFAFRVNDYITPTSTTQIRFIASDSANNTNLPFNGGSLVEAALDDIQIWEVMPINLITFSTNATCGNSDGTANVVVSGGTPGYTYSWSPTGGTNDTATGLAAGIYTVIVTDANGCVDSINVTVNNVGAPSLITTKTDISCNGLCDGDATANVSGGTSPYTYSWSPAGGTDSTASNLCAGIFTVTVTDDSNCIATVNVTITQPVAISIGPEVSTDLSCFGSNDGTITITASGGTATLNYSIDSGATFTNTTGNFTSLTTGTYNVMVQDANNCTQPGSTLTITEPTAITAPPISFTDDTNSSGVGTATIFVSGGTPSYTYSWAPFGGTDSIATGLTAGIYTVTVIDNNGCILLDTVIVDNITGISQSTTTGYNIRLYPNPTTGKFILQFGKYPKNLVITVLNLLGEVITKIENENPTFYNKFEIDLSSEANGLYFIKIQTATRIITRKIILDR
ncbi:MAG: T9SS type A sorting domain-containing protein [Cytophagales bacterium]|nr:T9SS type A sorting domain-containing protein [Cytophagales bacterium]